ncbi:TPA: restriction endonuclease subunit S [Legionella anisa]
MVPKGWVREPIKKICETIIDCVNKTAPVVDYQTPYKMIRTTNVRNGRVNTCDVRFATEETYKKWIRRGAPKKGDLIFTREAPVGEVGILENDQGIFLGQRTMMYRVNADIADNYFLFYSLQSRFCQKQIEDFSNGGTVAHMRVPDCGEIIINIPPLPEQKEIAQILSTWDKAITTTEKLLAKSEQQKKALMQQLLSGKKRFFEFNDDWNEYSLQELGTTYNGLSGKSKNDFKQGKPYIPYVNIFNNPRIEVTKLELVTIKSGEKQNQVKYGDIFFTTSSETPHEVGMSSVLLDDLDETYLNSFCFGFRLNDFKHLLPSFAQFYLRNESIRKDISSLAQGATRYNLSPTRLMKIKFNLPSVSEQQKIASILSTADREIEVIKEKLKGLNQEKKALMQQLLTGKRRVKVGVINNA